MKVENPISFVCSVCGRPYTIETEKDRQLCPVCSGSVEPVYDFSGKKEHYRSILQRGSSHGIWGYRELLPVDQNMEPVSLDEGNTPLLRADNLAKELGVRRLYLKNETLNPSYTYKDRFATIAVSMAKYQGKHTIALGSAGNAAAALAAFAAKGGMECFVLLPPGAVQERARQIRSYGANLITMEETINDCILMAKQGEALFGWENVSTATCFHPWAAEGYKTIGYEIGRQLDFKLPDWIVCPVGGGALLSKIYRGCQDMLALGLIDHLPRFAGVQAEGCMPLVQAYESGKSVADDWGTPDTIAFAIADVCTFESATVLSLLRSTGGTAVAVSDPEILEAMQVTGRKEAVLAEPASAVTVAGVKKLLNSGTISREESVCCIISGNGVRDLPLMVQGLPDVPVVGVNDVEGLRAAVATYQKGNNK